MTKPTIPTILNDPSVSYALKRALREALTRDPVDALRDAELLEFLLADRLHVLAGAPLAAGGGS